MNVETLLTLARYYVIIISGVADAIDENPEFVTIRRAELLLELDTLVSKKKTDTKAYEQALKERKEYVTSSKMQLAFLRAERFDVHLSAIRIVNFFQLKLDLFGSQKLTTDITMKDLSKEDKKSVESGIFQLLPVRDAAGRAIIMGIPCLGNYKNAINLVSKSSIAVFQIGRKRSSWFYER